VNPTKDGMSKIESLRRYAMGAAAVLLGSLTTISAADLGALYEYFHSLQPLADSTGEPTSLIGIPRPRFRGEPPDRAVETVGSPTPSIL
jgi:hypothetical protein